MTTSRRRLPPLGEEKITTINGVEYKGYDTREPATMQMDGAHGGPGTNVLGAVTGNPYAAFDNPNFTEDMLAAGASGEEGYVETRAPFDQLETIEMASTPLTGTNASESISQGDLAEPTGLPGALGF